MPMCEVCVSAVYDLASMYFNSFSCSLGTTKIANKKKKVITSTPIN